MRFALCVAVAAAAASSAQAQEKCFDKGTLSYVDCPQPAPAPALAPAAVEPVHVDYSGFYLGAHAGYGWGGMEGVYRLGDGATNEFGWDALDLDGFLAGGQLGYLHVYPSNWTAGVELDASVFFNADDATGVSLVNTGNEIDGELDWLASARLRGGYLFDDVMPFLTVGVAAAGYEYGAFSRQLAIVGTGERDETAFGAVVGGGVEFFGFDHWSVRAEGLYYFFDDEEDTAGLTVFSNAGDNAGLDDVIVGRIGVNYRF